MNSSQICPLCCSKSCEQVDQTKKRRYIRCNDCQLIFVPLKEHITVEQEKERYGLHENSNLSSSYRKYLSSIVNEIKSIQLDRPQILDFGAGEDFVLTRLLREEGFHCQAYDPLYNLGQSSLTQKYDLVIICEVIEHLRQLRKELDLLKKLLKPDGHVYLRTQFYPTTIPLSSWWYTNDMTHINFFSPATLKKVAQILNRSLLQHDDKQSAIIGPRH